ncbi:MAG: CsgG/HfaB family protein [Planctomycetota bacterium]|nr:CsgG/HfaB family protein [Planctomycetota bacterium]
MRTLNRFSVRRCALGLLTIGLLLPGVSADAAQGSKPRLAITKITANDAVVRQAAGGGDSTVLTQIIEGTDGQLMNAMQQTRKFELVGRSDLDAILKEQDLAASGLVDPGDPQTARQFGLAGVQYVATVAIDNFQDITARATVEGQFGPNEAERRTIQLQAVVRIYDTTTGTLLESTSVQLDESAVNEIITGAREDGRRTNRLIGDVVAAFSSAAANTITDAVLPPKVLAYTMGVISFNRTAASGVEPGQIWEVFAPGDELVDPDTGESLGVEEISIGWARVTDAGSKFSKARAIEDFGITRGSLMRLRPAGLPGHVDPSGIATGSDRSGRSDRAGGGDGRTVGDDDRPAVDGMRKMAIFVRSSTDDVEGDAVRRLEDQITSQMTGTGVELISRSIVLDAVSDLGGDGANRGTGDPMNTAAQRLLSDRASARSLASNLGADGLLVASITSYTTDTRSFRDRDLDVDRLTTFYMLDVTWSLLGADGGTLDSGMASARTGIQQSETLQREFDPLDQLLMDDARQIGDGVARAMRSSRLAEGGSEASAVDVDIKVVLADLSIPEIVEDANGNWIVTANRYRLSPMGATVTVDGFLAGSAPGPIAMSAGQHRLTIERPMLETVDRFVVARAGMELTIPMRFSDEGRRRWMETAAFIDGLKNGAVLRKVELEQAMGLAEFLRNSRITLDTTGVRNLSVGSRLLWGQLIDD